MAELKGLAFEFDAQGVVLEHDPRGLGLGLGCPTEAADGSGRNDNPSRWT